VKDKLWEVYISNGLLGTSGGISKAKVDLKDMSASMEHPSNFSGSNRGTILFRRTTKKGPWEDAASQNDTIPLESVLLFRSHHALADGASIMAALSDLCDEAEEIRENIRMELLKWKRRRDSKKGFFQKILSKIFRLIKLSLWFVFGTLRALAYQVGADVNLELLINSLTFKCRNFQSYLQLTTRVNPFDAVKLDAERKGLALTGRSISWCDAAPLDEAKTICKVLSKAKGSTITINDLFVSCITAAGRCGCGIQTASNSLTFDVETCIFHSYKTTHRTRRIHGSSWCSQNKVHRETHEHCGPCAVSVHNYACMQRLVYRIGPTNCT